MTIVDHGSEAALEAGLSGLSAASLRSWGRRPALLVGDTVVRYDDLADLVLERAQALGRPPRLVSLSVRPSLDSVVTLLASLEAGHPILLLGDDDPRQPLIEQYRPDVVARSATDGTHLVDHPTPSDRPSPHQLHPDLALLVSTSGSTGGRKLVRLSRRNIESNATAIAESLHLSTADRAITALPLHYCYGLSVLTSHLVVGASVVLAEHAVVDPCFWGLVDEHGVTGLATVPHSLELIARAGDRLLDRPSLRYVTQAGGRLAPERVVDHVHLGRRYGWDFHVMYGQTEATARMAVLPPDAALDRPASVGLAIPGGSFTIDESAEAAADTPDGVGEVVYRGPNVMMGYATSPDDLARGAELTELRTGDLGRLDDGFLSIVGRASRFVKPHGKRVDLDQLADAVATAGSGSGSDDDGPEIRCVGDDDGVVVVAVDDETGDAGAVVDDELRNRALPLVDVPAGMIGAVRVGELPRTDSGKVDDATLLRTARTAMEGDREGRVGDDGIDESVLDLYSTIFGRRDLDPAQSFASLGGDSFLYVEASIRLEQLLGELPADWHVRSIADLESLRSSESSPRRWVQLDTSVVIRAVCILLIVCTHMRLYRLPGGAHALLAVVGYNFARFQLPALQLPGRMRRMGATIARIAVPTSAWIGANMVLFGGYSLGALLLVNNYTGDAARRGGRWEYWYFEAFVHTMIVLAVLFSIAAVRRTERRAPFAFAMAILAATLAIRFDVVQWGGEYNEMFRPHTVACFVALGWAAAVSRNVWQRLLVTGLAVVTAVGYFGQTDREWRIVLFVAALVWLPTVRVPRRLAPLITTIAAASMWIFLVHWQVWPLFTPWFELHVAFACTIAVGVAVWWGYERVRRSVAQRRRDVGRSTSSQVSVADTATSTSDARPVSA